MQNGEKGKAGTTNLKLLAVCVDSVLSVLAPLDPAERDDVLQACLKLNRFPLEIAWPHRQKPL